MAPRRFALGLAVIVGLAVTAGCAPPPPEGPAPCPPERCIVNGR